MWVGTHLAFCKITFKTLSFSEQIYYSIQKLHLNMCGTYHHFCCFQRFVFAFPSWPRIVFVSNLRRSYVHPVQVGMVTALIPPGAVIVLWTAPSRILIVILIPCWELHSILIIQTIPYKQGNKTKNLKSSLMCIFVGTVK